MTAFTRRSFLASAAAAAGMSRAADTPRRKYKYIDIHTHLGAFYHDRELTAERLVRFMDAHGVERACVLPLVSPLCQGPRERER